MVDFQYCNWIGERIIFGIALSIPDEWNENSLCATEKFGCKTFLGRIKFGFFLKCGKDVCFLTQNGVLFSEKQVRFPIHSFILHCIFNK